MPIAAITPVAEGAVAVDLRIPAEHAARFAYRAGQFVTLQAKPTDAEGRVLGTHRHVAASGVRRSYSLVSTPSCSAKTGLLRVASREVEGGAMSTWLNRHARTGEEVGVAVPMGELTVAPDVPADATLGFVVAGSGITPVMSILTEGLLQTARRSFVVISGNRTRASAMFRPELLKLADDHAWRMYLYEVFSREPGDTQIVTGRLDRSRLDVILDTLADTEVHTWYTCGPASLVYEARAALEAAGTPPDRIRVEVFNDVEDE